MNFPGFPANPFGSTGPKLQAIHTYWVAVKELHLSYHNGGTLLLGIYAYTHCGNLI